MFLSISLCYGFFFICITYLFVKGTSLLSLLLIPLCLSLSRLCCLFYFLFVIFFLVFFTWLSVLNLLSLFTFFFVYTPPLLFTPPPPFVYTPPLCLHPPHDSQRFGTTCLSWPNLPSWFRYKNWKKCNSTTKYFASVPTAVPVPSLLYFNNPHRIGWPRESTG